MVGAAVAGLAMMTLAACSNTETGQASASAAGATGSGSPAISLPSRPKDIPLNGVDPCALLTAAQRSQFGINGGKETIVGHGETGKACGYNFTAIGSGTGGYDISTITSPGIEHWLNPNLIAKVKQVAVAGFPAVDITNEGEATGCGTAISVADGQMLMVDNGVVAQGMTSAQSCAKTNAVAEAAMATLQTLK